MNKTFVGVLAVLAGSLSASPNTPGTLKFDPTQTSFTTGRGEVISQNVVDRTRFSPGVMLVELPGNVDTMTIGGGVRLGRIVEKHLRWLDQRDYATALLKADTPTVVILPFTGWERDVIEVIGSDLICGN